MLLYPKKMGHMLQQQQELRGPWVQSRKVSCFLLFLQDSGISRLIIFAVNHHHLCQAPKAAAFRKCSFWKLHTKLTCFPTYWTEVFEKASMLWFDQRRWNWSLSWVHLGDCTINGTLVSKTYSRIHWFSSIQNLLWFLVNFWLWAQVFSVTSNRKSMLWIYVLWYTEYFIFYPHLLNIVQYVIFYLFIYYY